MKTLYFLIIIGIMFASCFVLPDSYAQDCMGGPFCGGNTPYFSPTSNRNVTVSLNFHSNSTIPDNVHYLWLRFFDAKNNELIKNVSFFINATKDNKVLMHELFYTKTGLMLMKFHSDLDTGKLIINGTSEPVLGGMMSENDTLPITASLFAMNGTYHIHLEVLAIDYVNELVDQSNPPTFDSWWSVDDKGNISKYDNHITGTSLQLENNTVANKIQSPLKQIDSGIPTENVACSSDLELIYKTSNKYPVCVKHATAEKLVQRGWAIHGQPINYFVKTDGFLMPYALIGGNMLGVKFDAQNNSIVFSIHASTNSGILYVAIPRALLDSKSAYSNQDTKFIILVDKHEIKYTETTSITNRTLSIPFDLGAKEIEVTATVGI